MSVAIARLTASFVRTREEEVQGLVQYIYTGQLSTTQSKESGWEKIIDDFKVGVTLDEEAEMASAVNRTQPHGSTTPSV